MSKITVKDVHVDAVLTNFSVGYHPGGMVAEKVTGVMKVKKESDKYYVWDRPSAFKVSSFGTMSLRADGTEAKVIDFGLSTSTYQAEEYALATMVTDRQKENADDVLKLRESKVRRIKDLLMLEQEIRVATLMTTTANWASGHNAEPNPNWNESSPTIEKDIDTGKEVVRKAIGFEPNTIIIPAAVAKWVKRDSTIRELIKYTQNDLLVNGDLPPTMFNMRVVIPGAIYTASTEGASSVTYSDVWSDNVVLLYVPPTTDLDSPNGVKIFRAQDTMVRTWREEKKKAEMIEVSVVQDEVITSSLSGYVLTNTLA